jgi:hypothetical protein
VVTTRKSVWRWAAVTGVAGLLGLAALLFEARRQAIESAHSGTCFGNLREIGLAMWQYENNRGALPPAYLADANGKPMHSWRVLILPYLGYRELYEQYDFNEPWDGPNNRRLADQMPETYRCPKAPADGCTSYAVVTGSGLVFHGERTLSSKQIAKGPGREPLLVIECPGARIPWMAPRDLDAPPALTRSWHPGEVLATRTDGSVIRLPSHVPPDVLREMLTPRRGEHQRTSAF